MLVSSHGFLSLKKKKNQPTPHHAPCFSHYCGRPAGRRYSTNSNATLTAWLASLMTTSTRPLTQLSPLTALLLPVPTTTSPLHPHPPSHPNGQPAPLTMTHRAPLKPKPRAAVGPTCLGASQARPGMRPSAPITAAECGSPSAAYRPSLSLSLSKRHSES